MSMQLPAGDTATPLAPHHPSNPNLASVGDAKIANAQKPDQPPAVAEIAKKVLRNCPNITAPNVKRRWFNTSNLTDNKIFFLRHISFAYQIIKKSLDDVHHDFRNVVAEFNKNKTEENLNRVLLQIQVLKSCDHYDETDESIKAIAHELVLCKLQFMHDAVEKVAFDPARMIQIDNKAFASNPSTFASNLKDAIGAFNQNKDQAHFEQIIKVLHSWQENDVKGFKEQHKAIEKLLHQLSSGIEDDTIYNLFNLLKPDESLRAHKDLKELRKEVESHETLAERDLIDIMHVKKSSLLSSIGGSGDVAKAIDQFNKEKNKQNLQGVVKALETWQFSLDRNFNRSNWNKIQKDINEILLGKTKQEQIKEKEGYQFLSALCAGLDKLAVNPDDNSPLNVAKWGTSKWKPIKITIKKGHKPSNELIGLKVFLNRINRSMAQNKLTPTELISLNEQVNGWITNQPDEFKACNGEALMITLRSNVQQSLCALSLDPLLRTPKKTSPKIQDLKDAIRRYNIDKRPDRFFQSRTNGHLGLIRAALEIIDKSDPDYTLYQLKDLEVQVRAILAKNILKPDGLSASEYPDLLVPTTHPNQVFERDLAFKEAAGKNAYLMVFHNPVMPWSHSEIAFVLGANGIKPTSFVEQSDKKLLAICEDVLKDQQPPNPKDKATYEFVKRVQAAHNELANTKYDNEVAERNKVVSANQAAEEKYNKEMEAYRLAFNEFEKQTKEYDAVVSRRFTKEDFAKPDFIAPDEFEDFVTDILSFMKNRGFMDENGQRTKLYFDTNLDKLTTAFNNEEQNYMRFLMPQNLPARPEPPAHPIKPPLEAVPPLPLKDPDLTPQMLFQQVGVMRVGISAQVYESLLGRGEITYEAIKEREGPEYAQLLRNITSHSMASSSLINESSNLTERSFMALDDKQSQEVYEFLEKNDFLTTVKKDNGEIIHLLKKDWEKRFLQEKLPKDLQPHHALLLSKLRNFGVEGQITKREYLGIGADQEGLESSSHHAEGVRISNTQLVPRLELLCRRRKNEIQRNMAVFAGAQGGLKSMYGGQLASMLITETDRRRHFKQALIDNFLTSVDPKSFLPDLDEPRFRLELYETGGVVYKKWIPDPKGQFSQIKNISSRDQSGEHMEGQYKKNSYALLDGKLKSIKTLDKERLKNAERGNLIKMADGRERWEADPEMGQYIKVKGAPAAEAERDDRTLYNAMSCEKMMSSNEYEWCGSYAVRMLHGAYAFEFMPEFKEILEKLKGDFAASTGYEKDAQFKKLHAAALFALAEKYADKMLASESGQQYFRDMNPTVKLSPRCTPDMIHEFFMGKPPGIVYSMRRAWKTIVLPSFREPTEGASNKASMSAASGGVGVLGLPFALLKLAFNIMFVASYLLLNPFISAYQVAKKRHAEFEREEESGIKSCSAWKWSVITLSALFEGVILEGVVQPWIREAKEVVDIAKTQFGKASESAFSGAVVPLGTSVLKRETTRGGEGPTGEKAKEAQAHEKESDSKSDGGSLQIHGRGLSVSRPSSPGS